MGDSSGHLPPVLGQAVSCLHVCTQAYARSLPDAPELADITAVDLNGRADMDVDGGAAAGRGKKRKRLYEDHRPMSSIAAGIKQGTLHQARPPADLLQTCVDHTRLCCACKGPLCWVLLTSTWVRRTQIRLQT